MFCCFSPPLTTYFSLHQTERRRYKWLGNNTSKDVENSDKSILQKCLISVVWHSHICSDTPHMIVVLRQILFSIIGKDQCWKWNEKSTNENRSVAQLAGWTGAHGQRETYSKALTFQRMNFSGWPWCRNLFCIGLPVKHSGYVSSCICQKEFRV